MSLEKSVGKGRIWEGGGRRSLRGQTAAIPPPATVTGVRGQPLAQPQDLAHFLRFLGLMPRERKQSPGMVRVLGAVLLWGADPWVGRQWEPCLPLLPGGTAATKASPSQDREFLACWGNSEAWGQGPLTGPLLPGPCRQTIRLEDRGGRRAADIEESFPGPGHKSRPLLQVQTPCPRYGYPQPLVPDLPKA